MPSKIRIVSGLLTIPLLAAACSDGSSGTSASKQDKGQVQSPYRGPTLPGAEAKPSWSAPSPGVVSAVGFGDAVAVLTGRQGYQVTVVDSATGKVRQRFPLAVAGDSTLPEILGAKSVQLLRDTVQGRPVIVVRFNEQVPGSGTQAEHAQVTDLVLDTAGRRVWRTPTTAAPGTSDGDQQRRTFEGGYAISQRNTQGTPDKASHGITTFRAVTSGSAIEVPASYGEDDVLDIVADTAVMGDKSDILSEGVKGVSLSQDGKTVWSVKDAQYLGTFGPNVMVATRDRVMHVDAATGQRRTDVKRAELDGDSFVSGIGRIESWAYDADSHAIIGSSNAGAIILDGDTGKLRWRQSGPNPRDLTPAAAAGGIAFMEIEPPPAPPQVEGAPEPPPNPHLALDDRTGKVLADNLNLTAIATTDSKTVMVEHEGKLYGFRLKTAP